MNEPSDAVLLIHDDPQVEESLGDLARQRGVSVVTARSAPAGLTLLEARVFDVVVLDGGLPGKPALELCSDITRRWPGLAVILLAPPGTGSPTDALRCGAADVVGKPCDRAEIVYAVHKALSRRRAPDDVPPERATTTSPLVGESKAMKQVGDLVRKVASGVATVLIRGETGTGKDLVARAIHAQSARARGPLIKVHCAALPDALLESELFGYEKGAFTGAASRKAGRVELAQGGTLFLDEIGDVTPAIQVKLLRLLQDREFERLGGTQVVKADVRFVAATHRDLESMVKKGEFREDLFYRLNVVALWVPPLRARRDDVEVLAAHFCATFAAENEKPGLVLDASAQRALAGHRWPGNVRQLQNFVERLVVLSDGPSIGAEDVERELTQHAQFVTQVTAAGVQTSKPLPEPSAAPSLPDQKVEAGEILSLSEEVRAAERRALVRALAHSGGNRTVAARILGISRATLYNKLEEHGVS